MFEIPSLPRIFPLGAILFNFLFLLVAIPAESFILYQRLKFDKKTSIFYGISINLISNVIGWIVFFIINPILPVSLQSELISYIFFNRFHSNNIQSLVVLTAFITFFTTFIVKYFLLRFFILLLMEPEKQEELPTNTGRISRRTYRFKLQNTNLVTTVLIANSISYTLIVFILFLRSVNL
ncbi:filament integrity protein FraC [Iningainema tapete]|uniref:filament integrity protein FraC n=1 Tax=Iningainema tapete TaxID=2806730 RepID=UPI001EE25230|nr:filament integrity protein FraC [Iningainema tapete]